MTVVEPDNSRAWQHCYHELRRRLIFNQIPPGARLSEVYWSRQIGAHRAALREAMVLLVHEGLLCRGSRGGFFMPLLEQSDVEEVWEARAVIEVGALQLIAARRAGGELEDKAFLPLLQLCDAMQALHDAGMHLSFIEADRKLHERLVELAGNRRLVRLYRQSPLPFLLWRTSEHTVSLQRGQETIDAHRTLIELLMTGRTTEAVHLLEQHLHVQRSEFEFAP